MSAEYLPVELSTQSVANVARRLGLMLHCYLSDLLRCAFSLWLTLATHAEGVLLIGNPVVESTPTQAVVRWTTDRESGTSVLYGPATERFTRRFKGRVGLEHRADLVGLEPGTRYRMVLGTARDPLRTNEFVTPAAGTSKAILVDLFPVVPAVRTNSIPLAVPEIFNPPPAVVRDGGKTAVPSQKETTTVRPPEADEAPPFSETWANPASLPDHFARHGGDFKAATAEDYAAHAWQFRQRAAHAGYRMKRDERGVLRIFDPASGSFGAYSRDGKTRTFFKPKSPDYFDRQPGTPVKPKKPSIP